MCKAKVQDSDELIKLKAEKMLTACKCSVEGCENVGVWVGKRQCYQLQKGMCDMHYKRVKNHGNPFADFTLVAKERVTNLEEILKLKENLKITSKKCKCKDCGNIGQWDNKLQGHNIRIKTHFSHINK